MEYVDGYRVGPDGVLEVDEEDDEESDEEIIGSDDEEEAVYDEDETVGSDDEEEAVYDEVLAAMMFADPENIKETDEYYGRLSECYRTMDEYLEHRQHRRDEDLEHRLVAGTVSYDRGRQ